MLAFFFVFAGEDHFFCWTVYKDFALVDEDDLDWLVTQSEYYCMPCSIPSSDINQLFVCNWFVYHILRLSSKVAFKVAKETLFFFQLMRILIKRVLSFYILSINFLDVIELIVIDGKHLRWVIEVNPKAAVSESISNTIFTWIINPFSDINKNSRIR